MTRRSKKPNEDRVRASNRTLNKHKSNFVPEESAVGRKGNNFRERINLYWKKRDAQKQRYANK